MRLLRLIRGGNLNPRLSPWGPWECGSILPLKLVSRHRAGGLVIGHYATHPGERPDHVFRHECRMRTFLKFALEFRLAVKEITTDQDTAFKHWPDCRLGEHLVVLSDEAGTVVLYNFCDAKQAKRAMAVAEQGIRGVR
jgi:hypothetical protein